MKTAFFIFELAETASVTAEIKSQLYTFAYTVSRIFLVMNDPSLQCPSFLSLLFFFKFLDSVEICCSHIGWQSCNLHSPSFIQIGSIADSKRLIQGFYPFLLALAVTEDAKSQPVDSLLFYNYVVCTGLQTHAKRLLVLKSPLCPCPLFHGTIVHLSQQV